MQLTRATLDASLAQGRKFLLANQRDEGNFRYEVNFLTGEETADDNQVRQAGALWGLALVHADAPTSATRDALLRGFAFFADHSSALPDGRMLVTYPGKKFGKTGTVALLTLALIDFLRTEDQSRYPELYDHLLGYSAFLWSLRNENGQFFENYEFDDGSGWGGPSPYFDGETLLALTRAVKEFGVPLPAEELVISADAMIRSHVTKALAADPDSAITKGFYQWGTMSFLELATSELKDTDRFARQAIDLAHWMIDIHRTLDRTRNTAYAYEGIISAYALAQRTGDTAAAQKFAHVIDRGLAKLTSWQVGGPMSNVYLQEHSAQDPRAVGGIMNAEDEPLLRIDVTQHQMHAVILARRYVYRE